MLRFETRKRLAHKCLSLATSRSVAHRNSLRTVLVYDQRDRLCAFLRLLLREYDRLAEILARSVYHRHLATCAYAGVDGQHRLFAKRTRQQQVAQVLRKHLDRRAVRRHLLVDSHVNFAARRKQTLVCVFCRKLHLLARLDSCRLFDQRQHVLDHGLGVQRDLDPQHALLLAAPDCEIPVARNRSQRLLELVVLLELRRLGRPGAGDLALDDALCRKSLAHEPANLRHIGDTLGQNVARELELLFAGVDRLTAPYRLRKRLETLLLRDLRTRTALRLVRLVKVLKGALLPASGDLSAKFIRQLALLVDRLQYRLLAALQLRVVFEPVLYLAYGDFVKVAVSLLAVAGYERHRAALAEKLFDSGDLTR